MNGLHPPQMFSDDPEPEEDEIVTPPELWFRQIPCDACLREAVAKCYIDRGEAQPARFNLCEIHTMNVALSGGEVVMYV